MPTNDNRATLEAGNAAISRGDHEGFLSRCTDDTRWEFVGEQTLEGKDAVRRWMAETYTEPPQFDVERMIVNDDHVVAIGEITLKADGKVTRSAYCDVWRFRDGKMAELRAFVVELGDGDS